MLIKRNRTCRKLSPELCQRICDLYLNEKLSSTEINEMLGVPVHTVIGVLKRKSIPRRGKSESVLLAYSRGRKIRPIAERNPKWQGGTVEGHSGYFMLWMPDYPSSMKKGYVYRHRYVYEQVHGKLPEGWRVHHINGVKGDDRPENLYAMPVKIHKGLDHKSKKDYTIDALRNRVRQLETQINQQSYFGLK